jgi:hypothetical protein
LRVGKATLNVYAYDVDGLEDKAEVDRGDSAKYIRANAAALLVTAKNARTKQNKKNKEDTETNAREAATRANAQATGL